MAQLDQIAFAPETDPPRGRAFAALADFPRAEMELAEQGGGAALRSKRRGKAHAPREGERKGNGDPASRHCPIPFKFGDSVKVDEHLYTISPAPDMNAARRRL